MANDIKLLLDPKTTLDEQSKIIIRLINTHDLTLHEGNEKAFFGAVRVIRNFNTQMRYPILIRDLLSNEIPCFKSQIIDSYKILLSCVNFNIDDLDLPHDCKDRIEEYRNSRYDGRYNKPV